MSSPTGAGSGDTIFGTFERASLRGDGSRRALAGLRDGSTWVELSYEELLADIVTVSERLCGLGMQRGDVLCVQLPNWTEAVVYAYAAARAGLVICPITTIYRQRELTFILERTQAKVIVVPATYRGYNYAAMGASLRERVATVEHVIAVGPTQVPGLLSSAELRSPALPAPEPAEPAGLAEEDLAVLAFTSGTTGESKGVMHSHASMHAAIDEFVDHAGFGEGLTSLVMSPFGHLTGFTWGILMPLRNAGDVVLLETWDPERALELFARYSVAFTMGATPFLADLLDAAGRRDDASFPDIFVCAGAPIPPALIERAVSEHHCRVVSGWGMSEYPIGTSTAVTDDPVLASTSDGRPTGRTQIRLVDPAGAPVGIGEEGDLLIRGPGLFQGYYKRPDLDAVARSNGYLMTGDRARLLDEAGHIRISGRTKDLIIRGGENIPVVEIENLLLQHPGIREVALVPTPHERLGETACACIVADAAYDEELTVTELGRFLAEHGVAKQFWPEAIRLLSELPRTPSGKIQKFLLRGAAAGAEPAPGS